MRYLLPTAIIILVLALISCSSKKDTIVSLCKDPCLKDTLKFNGEHELNPYLYIVPANCFADTLVWSHKLMINDRKIVMSEYTKRDVMLGPETAQAFFKDTSYVWLMFNDCNSGRGYVLQLPYNKSQAIKSYSSALNRFDPKFSVSDGLIAYADYSFLYIQDMNTGKTEQVLLSDKELEIDFNEIHKTFDSINVTRNRVWVKMEGKEAVEKKINL